MQILSHDNYLALLDYLPTLKASLNEWQLVDIKLTEVRPIDFTAKHVAELVHAIFREKEGKIFVCNAREVFMLIRWGSGVNPQLIAEPITAILPAGSCEIVVQAPTPEGIGKLELLIRHGPSSESHPAEIRARRRENVILIADDDMFMRTLIKRAAGVRGTIHEEDNGNTIVAAYKQNVPDILFLDIHLPGRNGLDILSDIKAFDLEAYVVMLSADSSRSNVERAMDRGAKGFVTKPFTKEKLEEHFRACPTFS